MHLLYFGTWICVILSLWSFDYCRSCKDGIYVSHIFTAQSSEIKISNNFSRDVTIFNPHMWVEVYKFNKNEIIKVGMKMLSSTGNNLTLECSHFLTAGFYEIKLMAESARNIAQATTKTCIRQNVTVQWPPIILKVSSDIIETHPKYPVKVYLSIQDVACDLKEIAIETLPVFQLQIIYCGNEKTSRKVLSTDIVHSEDFIGFPKSRIFNFGCDLFVLAGQYCARLKFVENNSTSIILAEVFFKAKWNKDFDLNVTSPSIFPCNPIKGVELSLGYPTCNNNIRNRVRIYSKQLANIVSVKPPTYLKYITEKNINNDHRALYFNCNLFSEKYFEYCFVYVTQIATGAVKNVQIKCLSTLPKAESTRGNWSKWSEWTPCSTTCSNGTKHRYRICNSPVPLYGTKFCKGPAVETQSCGTDMTFIWKCFYEMKNQKTLVSSEIPPNCRCGCLIELKKLGFTRILGASLQNCLGRSFWLFKSQKKSQIEVVLKLSKLPCRHQFLKIRDGSSSASKLIYQVIGGTLHNKTTQIFQSSKSELLIELFSSEFNITGDCKGGFIAHIQQIIPNEETALLMLTQYSTINHTFNIQITFLEIICLVCMSIIISLSIWFGSKILRYSKTNNHDSTRDESVFSEDAFLLYYIPNFERSINNGNCNKLAQAKIEAIEVSNMYGEVSNSLFKIDIQQINKNLPYLNTELALSANNIQRITTHAASPVVTRSNEILNSNYSAEENPKTNLSPIKHAIKLKDDYHSESVIVNVTDKDLKNMINLKQVNYSSDSSFSFGNQEEPELDYYDYNVLNAGAAPGSVLGKEPTYLLWIPQIDELSQKSSYSSKNTEMNV